MGADVDPVEEFAAWLRALHREARKPSYAEIVRRIRAADPSASIVVSTISETLNGKRLPRWTTVEPIARALGGPAAVQECLHRWKRADAARTTTTAPPAPETPGPVSGNPPPRQQTTGSGAEVRTQPPNSSRSGRPVPRRKPLLVGVVSTAAAAGLALAIWLALPLLDAQHETPTGRAPKDTASTSSPAAPGSGPADRTPTAGASSGASEEEEAVLRPFKPGTHEAEVIATSGKPWSTPDGRVSITVLGASTVGDIQVFATTPTTSCPETSLAIGEALIIPEASSTSWTRITPLRAWTKEPPEEVEFPDIHVKLQVDQGTGPTPRGKRCGP
ncbi:MAG TPA: helix-turn-helix transcriptional regulator [Streptomyces sp.]|uniref:helix-turn-helix domain-containing protein n=1 Tax=Streptomyces sp. TaxID=1931 RepID=UPI002BED4025|nr:helix-turn-helix transcriptional regulator [Streptomyces sp.]HWU08587.1 helix-turn-helix transcriptional regulator [Streptomyces sp.]